MLFQVIGLPSQNLGYLLCLKLVSMGVNVSAQIELRDIGAESKVNHLLHQILSSYFYNDYVI